MRFIVNIVAEVSMEVVPRWLLVVSGSWIYGDGGHDGIQKGSGSCERE